MELTRKPICAEYEWSGWECFEVPNAKQPDTGVCTTRPGLTETDRKRIDHGYGT